MRCTLNILSGRLVVRFVADFSRPWGMTMHGGRFVRFAWCWGQAETRTCFMFFRVLALGPVGVCFGRVIGIEAKG